jgi:hypothetical protein
MCLSAGAAGIGVEKKMAVTTRFPATDVGGGLAPWAGAFARYPGPRIIAAALLAVTAARVALGRWHWWDLLIVGAFIAAQPFTEWLIHVFILHFKPRVVAGRTIDPFISRKHRAHHLDPRDVPLVFIPLPTLLGMLIGGGLVLGLAFRSAERSLTAGVIALCLVLVYEWTHFLIHSPYRPQSAVYRYVWRAHRLHHFKNENYWFGVTVHLADHVLRTFPEKSAVPTSPTCRTLA